MKKILCIHGIGGKERTTEVWQPEWKNAISSSLGVKPEELEFKFLSIDRIFEKYAEKNGIKYLKAIAKLIKDWVSSAFFKEEKSLFGKDSFIRWYAGMVVQFVEDKELRDALHLELNKELNSFNPDVIYSHSLGTLISYDLLRQEAVKGVHRDLILITSGSQIGHSALLQFFGGKIMPLSIKKWINLHNPHDFVFAYEPIEVYADNYIEVETAFKGSMLINNHDVISYIKHESALIGCWSYIRDQQALGSAHTKNLKPKALSAKKGITKPNTEKKRITKKALLVGINDYPNPEYQLNGCVNDVFRMSEVLQEMGFQATDIKVVLNERATSQNLRRMMDWLLSDAKEGDLRYFYFSGHGAQIPSTAIDGEDDDHLDECLVTYDFDWNRENCYTDKEFLSSYSKLPYETNFITILDCCHSGGMTRDAGPKARGINPPDDIRHRTIKWDAKKEMWVSRDLNLSKQKLFDATTKTKDIDLYIGEQKSTQRFGRAISLWSDVNTYNETKKKYGTKGPYMPLIIESCKENEYSYEYKHGVTSYGAFTYALTTQLRQINRAKKNQDITYQALINAITELLKELGFQQTPQIIGPGIKTKASIPLLKI